MKVAIVHDWLVTYAGAERVLEQIIDLYPKADLFSLIDHLSDDRKFIFNKTVNTSFLQHFPFVKKKYRLYLPLMPTAIERFDFSSYDLIISSSHAVAKGVKTNPDSTHICYCHTPIRYAWDLYDQYLEDFGLDKGLKSYIAKSILNYIKKWDFRTSNRVNYFIANSKYVSDRIRRIYGRDSKVIYPPVDTNKYTPKYQKENFYLTASRMVPYKKIDLIVEAFASMPDKKLIVVGDGLEYYKIKSKSANNIELLGFQRTELFLDYMQRARAFVFAADEDFGITPVEAQACGTPVIAYGKGGVLETIINNKTGILFNEQNRDSLIDAVQRFENSSDLFNYSDIRKNAERFSIERFRYEFKKYVDDVLMQ